ncbi:MAG: hypothetical protein SF162_15355 [bacterium]|nr:hypothetical protein [bacterium]
MKRLLTMIGLVGLLGSGVVSAQIETQPIDFDQLITADFDDSAPMRFTFEAQAGDVIVADARNVDIFGSFVPQLAFYNEADEAVGLAQRPISNYAPDALAVAQIESDGTYSVIVTASDTGESTGTFSLKVTRAAVLSSDALQGALSLESGDAYFAVADADGVVEPVFAVTGGENAVALAVYDLSETWEPIGTVSGPSSGGSVRFEADSNILYVIAVSANVSDYAADSATPVDVTFAISLR